jgi:putative membrane protein
MNAGPAILAQAGGSWSIEPGVAVAVSLAGIGYGVAVVRRKRRHGRLPVGRGRVGAFYAGLGLLAAALAEPLDGMASTRFSAHMVQHLVIMVAAAPLLVGGRPGTVALSALPAGARRSLHRATRAQPLQALSVVAVHPIAVWIAGAAVLWAWHLPVLYERALTDTTTHATQHAAFLVTSVLFWRLVLDAGRRRAPVGRPAALALVFATALQSSALGAVLTFAGAPLYPLQAARAAADGAVPIQDQQLAGALMWVPPGAVYLVVMATLLVHWFNELDRRGAGADVSGRTARMGDPTR